MFDTSNREDPDQGIKLHLQEAELLKKQWFSYVFDTIKELHDKVEGLNSQVQKGREEFIIKLMDIKEKLSLDIKNFSDMSKKDLQDVEKKLIILIDELTKKIGLVDDCVDSSIESSEQRSETSIDNLNTQLNNLKIELTTVKAKVGVYIVMTGLIVTAVVSVIAGGFLVFFKDAIQLWLGIKI